MLYSEMLYIYNHSPFYHAYHGKEKMDKLPNSPIDEILN